MSEAASSPRSLPQPGHHYQVAVVGAGLAGSELAWRLARAGLDVLLVTQALDTLGNLYQAQLPLQFLAGSLIEQARQDSLPRTDGWALHRRLKEKLEATDGIHLLQSCVRALRPGQPHVLDTWEGPPLRAEVVVLAVGAFLHARLTSGSLSEQAGRLSEVAYDFLADDLLAQGVAFEPCQDEVEAQDGVPGYAVQFQTLASAELEELALGAARLRRWSNMYALGRCCPGEWSYDHCLQVAAALAQVLGQQLLSEVQT